MKSYTTLRNLYGSLTNNTNATNLTLGDQMINDSIRQMAVAATGDWWWLEKTQTIPTVASQESYQIPNSVRKLMAVIVTVGTQVYMPEPVFDPNRWNLLKASQMGTSDIPMFYYRDGNKIYFCPIPASSSNTIGFRERVNIRDLGIADYSTGTIVSIANGATTVVGNGTTFTASMVGRYIRITSSDTANKGDGFWYEIGSYTNATTIDLVKPYEGTSIAAGTAAYVIGQMSVLPEAYDVGPVYRSAALYWAQQNDLQRANMFWRMYDGGVEAGIAREYGGIIGAMIQEASEKVESAYLAPFASGLYLIDPNYPQPTASGF